ncbi:hypothetical protein DXN04_34020 [Chitinophaga silvisoli]|uniref:Uncharacterized protein n=1 Tax=Chitinophaga silvisoli TaxID=2291814 RepID=A0A3E1NMN4_9BACT|nr:hypothetical protein DXN04_34020 [Chitinophaga silvisoli]
MRIFVGQLVLFVTIFFCLCSSFSDYSYKNAFNLEMFVWTIFLIGLGIWTFWSPRLAFSLILIYYSCTAIYRFFILEIDILLYVLWHIIFIITTCLSIWGAYVTKGKKNGANDEQILKVFFRKLMDD